MRINDSLHIFYANQLHLVIEHGWRGSLLELIGGEIYNGGYVLAPDRKWYRCDLTPVLDEDVPLELKALCLLMGLSF